MDGLKASASAPLLDRLSVLSDPVRPRLLLLLEAHELTVTELCAVLQLPQSTMSRHLKALSDSGWVASRAEGTSHLYTLAPAGRAPAAAQLWALVKTEIAGSVAAKQDAHRLAGILAERQSRSREFFASSAGQWDRMREELFGGRFHLTALVGLLDEDWVVGDLGCGTGQSRPPSRRSSGRSSRSTARRKCSTPRATGCALGRSGGQRRAAARHARGAADRRRDTRRGVADAGAASPAGARPGAGRDGARAEAGRAAAGRRHAAARSRELPPADGPRLARLLGAADRAGARTAGFTGVRIVPLPADAAAKGPALFAATARRGTVAASKPPARPNRTTGRATARPS